MEANSTTIFIYVLQSVLVLLAIPAYFLLITVLIRYRSTDELKTPYYRLLLSLAINNILSCFVLASTKLTTFIFDLHIFHPKLLGIALKVSGPFFNTSNHMGLAIISYNRFKAIFNQYWSDKMTKVAIIVQWTCSVIMALPGLVSGEELMFDNKTGTYSFSQDNAPVLRISTAVMSLITMGCTFGVIIFYSLCLGKVIHHRIQMRKLGIVSVDESYKREIMLGCQGALVSAALVGQLVCVLLNLADIGFFIKTMMAFYFANFYLDPFVALVMSQYLREYVMRLFGRENNQVIPINAVQ